MHTLRGVQFKTRSNGVVSNNHLGTTSAVHIISYNYTNYHSPIRSIVPFKACSKSMMFNDHLKI